LIVVRMVGCGWTGRVVVVIYLKAHDIVVERRKKRHLIDLMIDGGIILKRS